MFSRKTHKTLPYEIAIINQIFKTDFRFQWILETKYIPSDADHCFKDLSLMRLCEKKKKKLINYLLPAEVGNSYFDNLKQ